MYKRDKMNIESSEILCNLRDKQRKNKEYNYILHSSVSVLNVVVPDRYEDTAIFFDFNFKHIVSYTDEERMRFLEDFVKKEAIRISCINGYTFFSTDCCNYCCCELVSKDSSCCYYCLHCFKNMCYLCYVETSEDIAKKNRAKYYHTRKDEIENCRKSGLLRERRTDVMERVTCDECHKGITGDMFYTSSDEDYDVCEECFSSSVSSHLSRRREMHLTENRRVVDQLEFGSMLDWVPFYRDDDENIVAKNCNPLSEYFGKVCIILFDDHSRGGFFVIQHCLQQVIDYLVSAKEIDIGQYARSLGIPDYFG